MKKQILLLVLMIFSGVFIASVKKSGLKACAGQAAVALSANKCSKLTLKSSFVEDADASYNMFINPFERQ